MKNIIFALTIFLFLGMIGSAMAQTETVRIQTSAVCSQCKDRIENDLSFERGVKSVNLDLKTKAVTVVYNPKKTDVSKIREAITKIGYNADSLQADTKSYQKLPSCCKHDGKQH